MADNDPRLMALQNVQDQSRAFTRGRRRGVDANVDPEFRAALEIADPEARRAALAQYARQRAQGLFADGAPQTSARDLVREAFPDGDAFANVRPGRVPSQADVMAQVDGEPAPRPRAQKAAMSVAYAMPRAMGVTPHSQGPRMQEAEDKQAAEADAMYDLMQRYGRDGDMEQYQAPGLPVPEDGPEAHQALMQRGRDILAPSRGAIDQEYADAAYDAADDRGIEGRDKGAYGGTPNPANTLRRRR